VAQSPEKDKLPLFCADLDFPQKKQQGKGEVNEKYKPAPTANVYGEKNCHLAIRHAPCLATEAMSYVIWKCSN